MKLVVANWKNHPASEAEALSLAEASDLEGLVVCPPTRFLAAVGGILQHAVLGSQDLILSQEVRYAIIGHSDRRREGETNEITAEKTARTLRAGITPILCVGETREQKDRGEKEKAITEEIKVGLSLLKSKTHNPKPFYIAYEPIWAISTTADAQPDKPEDTLATIGFIKQILLLLDNGFNFPVRFLYGGSVGAGSIDQFLLHPEIGGFLVGAASLNPHEIKTIYEKVNRSNNYYRAS